MGKDLGLGKPVEATRHAGTPEGVLGRLLQGLAEWHLGDPRLGTGWLEQAAAELRENTAGRPEWVSPYAGLLPDYEADIALLATLDDGAAPTTADACKTALDSLHTLRGKLRTKGRWTALLEEREKGLRRDMARLRMEEQRREMVAAAELRDKELTQLAELSAALPSLAQGYNYARVVALLRDIRFQSPEVQAALEGKLYLYEQARAFLEQWFADIAAQGWQGRLQRTEGGSLEGRITTANLEQVTVSLERGVVPLPLESLAPETLLESAQAFAAQTTDSADYYSRQERIAVFARVVGLHSLSATVAAQLMEEHRGFRLRWMKVVQ